MISDILLYAQYIISQVLHKVFVFLCGSGSYHVLLDQLLVILIDLFTGIGCGSQGFQGQLVHHGEDVFSFLHVVVVSLEITELLNLRMVFLVLLIPFLIFGEIRIYIGENLSLVSREAIVNLVHICHSRIKRITFFPVCIVGVHQWFRNELKTDNIERGRELIERYAKGKGYTVSELLNAESTEAVLRKYGFKDWNALLAAIGHGGLKDGQVGNKMIELYDRTHKKPFSDEQLLDSVAEVGAKRLKTIDAKSGVVVEGVDDVAFRFGKCCSPIPGDDIIGFVTRGNGVSIHRVDCVNIRNLPEEDKERLIEADWSEKALTADHTGKYIASITIYANNRTGLLVDITRTLTEKNVAILSLSTATSKKEIATIQVSFEIRGKDELNNIVEKLGQIESVINIERTSN